MELRISCKGLTSSLKKRRSYRYRYSVYKKKRKRRDSLPIESGL